DVRYRGQGFELNVPFDRHVLRHFHEEHAKRYGYSQPDAAVEIVNVRLRAWIASAKLRLKHADSKKKKIPSESRKLIFGGRVWSPRVLERDSLGGGAIRGPAIITEYSATTVIPPGWSGRRDRTGNLVLQPK